MRIKNARLYPTAFLYGKTAAGEWFMSFLVKATFRMDTRGTPASAAAKQQPILKADERYDPKKPDGLLRFESDLVPFKPRADIVLVGSAYAPHGQPTHMLDVEIQVGQTQRVIRVIGDRLWSFPVRDQHAPICVGPSEFSEMPLTYGRAFGGIDRHAALDPQVPRFRPWWAQNYAGKGFIGALSVDGIHRRALPNLEDPHNPIQSVASHPAPMGCGFFPRGNEPRSTYAGTYDERWKVERAPELPEDFRFDYFNGAHPHLQVEGHLAGNEPVRLTNVSKTIPVFAFQLPGIRPVFTVSSHPWPSDAAEPDREAPLTVRQVIPKLDTLTFVPDEGLFFLVWRGGNSDPRPSRARGSGSEGGVRSSWRAGERGMDWARMRLRSEQIAAVAQSHSLRTLADAFADQGFQVARGTQPSVVLLRDPEGSTGTIDLDAHGLIARYRYPSGRQYLMRYSEDHRLTGVQLPSGLQTTFGYDGSNRLAEVNRAGTAWRLEHDATDQVSQVSYPDNSRERFDRDGSGVLSGYVDRIGRTTQISQDGLGRVTRLRDANGNATTFRYSDWQRPDALERPNGATEELRRDGAGRPTEALIDGESVALPQFDGDRISEIRYADGECLSFSYDDEGRFAQASNGAVTVARTYDDTGRLIGEQIADQAVTASYTFDGQLEQLVTSHGSVHFHYDGDRRLVSVEDWAGGHQRYAYDSVDGGITRSLPGLREETKLTQLGLTAQVVTHAVPGEVLQMWQQYAHDPNDRVAMGNDSHFGQSAYSYDAEGQLLSVTTPTAERHFAYDPVGNRTFAAGVPATFDVSNQMLTAGAERMVYDQQGNLVSRDNGNGVTRYEFSTRNLLKSVVRGDGLRIELSYDAFGRRVSKRVGKIVTRYMWFGNHMIYEWVESDPSVRREYLYKPGTHEPLAMRQNGAVYYFHNGHDGAPRRLSDSAGRIIWMGQYDAFGTLLRQQGDVSPTVAFRGAIRGRRNGALLQSCSVLRARSGGATFRATRSI